VIVRMQTTFCLLRAHRAPCDICEERDGYHNLGAPPGPGNHLCIDCIGGEYGFEAVVKILGSDDREKLVGPIGYKIGAG